VDVVLVTTSLGQIISNPAAIVASGVGNITILSQPTRYAIGVALLVFAA
jgi:hypothetical protein